MEAIVAWFQTLKPLEIFFVSITVAVAGFGTLGVWAVHCVYQPVLTALADLRVQGPEAQQHWWVSVAISEYETSLQRRGVPPEPSLVVDRLAHRLRAFGIPALAWVRLVRMTISVCVAIGLIGTFVGLIIALFGVSGALEEVAKQQGATEDIIALLGQLKGLISGMSTAFQASVWGVAGSLFLTVLSTIAGTFSVSDRAASELEHYLGVEHLPENAPATLLDLQREVILKIDRLSGTLEVGLSSGLGEAAQKFAVAAGSISEVLKQVEPVTRSLGASGTSLQSLSQAMAEVTTELRQVMKSLQIGQQVLPERIAELKRVEEDLIATLRTLPQQNTQLLGGLDTFQATVRQVESSLGTFSQQWPDMVQEFVTRTEEAVDRNAVHLIESLDRLNYLIEQGQKEGLQEMQNLVSVNQAAIQLAAASMENGRG